jgi:ferredoxin
MMTAGKRLVRVIIDPDRCVGSALCVGTDPQRFAVGPDGKAQYVGANFDTALAEDAAELCPQTAITLDYEDDDT